MLNGITSTTKHHLLYFLPLGINFILVHVHVPFICCLVVVPCSSSSFLSSLNDSLSYVLVFPTDSSLLKAKKTSVTEKSFTGICRGNLWY